MNNASLTGRLGDQKLISLVLFAFAVWAAWYIGQWVANGDLKSVIFVGLGATVCTIAFIIIKDWRVGTYIFIAWLLFEDFVRKYLGNNMVIYFAKDALAVLIYCSFFAACRKERLARFRFPFLIFLAFFIWLGALECFNPSSPSLLYSLLGIKLYFFYVPLMFVGYRLFQNDKDLRRFLIVSVGLAGIIALLGIIQAIRGPSFLNPNSIAPELQDLSLLYRVAPISKATLYQPNSVFVSSGRFDMYLFLAWLLGLGAAGYMLLKRTRGQIIVFLALSLVVAAAVMGGGRGSLMYVIGSGIVVAFAFLWGTRWRDKQMLRILRAVRRAAVVAAVSLCFLMVLFPEAIGARISYYLETMLPSSPAEQLTARINSYPVQEFEKAFKQGGWLFGHGIGTASLGGQYVSRWTGENRPAFGVESGYGNLVLEFGVLGLALWFLWTATLLGYSWKVVRKLRGTPYFPLAFCALWFSFIVLYPMVYGTLSGYQDFIYNAYLWLLIGILYRLPSLATAPVPDLSSHAVIVHET